MRRLNAAGFAWALVFPVCCLLMSAVLMPPAAFAATGRVYYLSPEGDDGAEGGRERPWRTIEKANSTLRAGDTAVFLPGDYEGSIRPENSGEAGAPITYRSVEPEAARILPAADHGIDLADLEYIVVSGFRIDGRRRADWVFVRRSSHIQIIGCRMVRESRWMPARFEECRQLKLLDNSFDCSRVDLDMLELRDSEHVLIEGNSFGRAGHNPCLIRGNSYVVLRANSFHNDWGRWFIWYDPVRILAEGNVLVQSRDGAFSAGGGAMMMANKGIYRFNRIYGSLDLGMGTSAYGNFMGLVDTRIYHNTFADNLGIAWRFGNYRAEAVSGGNIFQNNIFSRNNHVGGNVQMQYGKRVGRANRFLNNLFRGAEPGQKVIIHKDVNIWNPFYLTVEEANRHVAEDRNCAEFENNMDADPGFVDAAQRDYRLRAGSAAIDAGRPLALAVGDGRGRELPVTDGLPFYDGFGIEGEVGDVIAVADPGRRARIERVEFREDGPALLHLDGDLHWRDGDAVSLPWAGAAPDMGAYQFGLDARHQLGAVFRPAVPAPGQPVRFAIEEPGAVESIRWDFGDGNVASGPDVTHVFERSGSYGVTIRASFTGGGRRTEALFVRVEEPFDPRAPLVDIDFEGDTGLWGYHFKSYRPRMTGYGRRRREDGQGHAYRLFYRENRGNTISAVLAPGKWKIEAYPFIQFDYRIAPGTPVGVCVQPFEGMRGTGVPNGFRVASTLERGRGSCIAGSRDLVMLEQYYPTPLGGDDVSGMINGVSRSPNRRPTSFGNQDIAAIGDLLGIGEDAAGKGDVEMGNLLHADGEWHNITIDLRQIPREHPQVRYLHRFLFHLGWAREGQELWIDNFKILPAE